MSKWPLVPLGDIFNIARGGSPRPIDQFITDDPSGINWIMIGDASEGSKYISRTKKRILPSGVNKSRLVRPGDFLLTNSMSFGRPYIMQTSGCIHDGWLVLSRRTDNVNQNFFYHLLASDDIYSEFQKRASGATVKNLNIDLVSGVKVPLPSLDEQHQIAAILDQADELRQKRRIALQKIERLSEHVFIDLFGHPSTNPHHYPEKQIGLLGKITTGLTPPSSQPNMFGGRVPFVTPGDLESTNMVKRSLSPEGARSSRLVRRGATLVCCIGATIGKIGIASEESAFNQQINAVEWGSEILDEYGLEIMRLRRNVIVGESKSTTMPILKKSSFQQIKIPVPPVELQQEFAKRKAEIAKIIIRQRDHLCRLDALFSSLRHRFFSGYIAELPEHDIGEVRMAG